MLKYTRSLKMTRLACLAYFTDDQR